ncbi:MAG: TrmH family RNA methyltransferase [Candidatus Saccharibacteria bacterium]|nr:TrmH family RNA methyltransferase [Candidatus Saccharibacteria bacterium]
MEVIVILHNIRSTYNVGAILRSCDGFGVKKAIFSGITPRVNDERLVPNLREKLNHQIAKSALGAERTINCAPTDNLKDEFKFLRDHGYVIVGLENNIQDSRLVKISEVKEHSGNRIALILGEEVKGIPKDLYGDIDIFAEIPMKGKKESFNVSVATGIALYELNR